MSLVVLAHALLIAGDASPFGRTEGVVIALESAAPKPKKQTQVDPVDGTYIFSRTVPFGGERGLPAKIWRPSGANGAPVAMPITYPEVCSADAIVRASNDNKMPGYGSKKVALVFRGDSFRGLSYATSFEEGGKLPFYCTDRAADIQKALAASHLKFIVEPIEAAGFKVSIFLSGYGCTGLPHIDEDQARHRWEELKQWYGSRVVASEVMQRTSTQKQDTGVHHSMRLLLSTAPLDFEFVLLWRYDLMLQKTSWAAEFLPVAQRQIVWFEDDWGYSFPGWYSNCAVAALLHQCMQESLVCIRALKLNFQRGEWLNIRGQGHIYRDDYTEQGMAMCAVLQGLGGPECAVSPQAGYDAACAYIKTLGGRFSADTMMPYEGRVVKSCDGIGSKKGPST